jgi:class 3 adenylate cyclase/tetratricopeptide (TPR) repeat protein
MFSDVSGFTAMSERLDPEEVHAIMDRAFRVIIDAVHQFEGNINQFLGDGVMALFGAPIAHEDHPHRAIRTALAIQDGLTALKREVREKHGIRFRIRMGINTGTVFVGAIGQDLRQDYTAVGDTTNLAARLLALAGPGEILVSAHTEKLTHGFFDFLDRGEFAVKGKTEPVHVYQAMRELRGRTRLEVSRERGLTPMVGRTRELGQLEAAYRRAARGEGAIILLTGEPGMGKSRLLYEFLHRLEAEGAQELEATGVAHGRSIPYLPILELVRRDLGLTEGMTPDDVRQRVAERLRELGLADEEPLLLLLHFLNLPVPQEFLTRLAGAQLRERTFRTLAALWLRASATRPVVLVVENVHWLDSSSEEFLQHLSRALAGHRVLLLLSTRPGYQADWLQPPLADTVAVAGLPPDEVRDMVVALLRADVVAPSLLDLLVTKGEGNPLYIEEIVRQLADTGGILVQEGEVRLAADDVKVPATIHDLIAARIDRLPDGVKHTLQVAAVVGRQFAVPLLSRVVETAATLPEHLRDLETQDFVFTAALEPHPVYSFKHALTQDVAYASLLERRRRGYHAAVGAGLEELYAGRVEDVVELLAHHFGRSAEGDKAVDYAILAGEKAQRSWANREAVAQFEAALKRLDSMPDTGPNRVRRIDGVVKQAEIKFALGKHVEHVAALEAIKALVEASADPPRRAAWYCWTGFLHSFMGGRPEVPIAYCREASAIASANGLDEIRGIADCCLTHVNTLAGNLREALEAGERALEIFEPRGNVWWACRTLWGLSMAANASGQWERSLEYCRRALEHGKALNDLRLKVVGWWRTGSTHVQRGDVAAGLRCYEEALALSPIPFDAMMAKAGQAYGQVKAGDLEAGMRGLRDAMDWFERSNLRFSRNSWGLRLAEGHMKRGEWTEARGLVAGILATCREFGHRHLQGAAERTLGEILAHEDPAAAVVQLEQAVETLETIGARDELARAFAAQASLRRAAGERAGARRLLRRALALFEELGTLDELPRVQAALAGLDVGPGEAAMIVVARDRPELYRQLAEDPEKKPDVRVVLDRREVDRRARDPDKAERRQGDRRARPDVDAALQTDGYARVTEGFDTF